MLTRYTYAHPEMLRKVMVDGKEFTERVPGAPTRPAKDYEINIWYEEVDDVQRLQCE